MGERKEMQKKRGKENMGITLIALVITIIVLLILAAVSIATLTGENGILNQASRAADNTKNATEKEQVQLAYDAQMSKNMENGKYTVGTDEDDIKGLQEELDNLDTGATANGNGEKIEVVFPNENKYRIQGGKVKGPIKQAKVGEKVEGENKEYTNEGTAVIPVGFAIVPNLDNVSEGLVISDVANDKNDEGNQFVWVPVEDFSEFVRYDFQNDKALNDNFTEPTPDNIDKTITGEETIDEVKKMYASVKENGGFYIGRYEAGKDDENKSVCKKRKTVCINIKWGNSMTDETGGAVEEARNFVEETYTDKVGVTSTLVYGVQWDAVMRWISNDESLKECLKDSKGKGVYDTNKLVNTGSNYQMKNIYDMAGNVNEWTMESYLAEVRVVRGGAYYRSADKNPVSSRDWLSPGSGSESVGFRLALYVR